MKLVLFNIKINFLKVCLMMYINLNLMILYCYKKILWINFNILIFYFKNYLFVLNIMFLILFLEIL